MGGPPAVSKPDQSRFTVLRSLTFYLGYGDRPVTRKLDGCGIFGLCITYRNRPLG